MSRQAPLTSDLDNLYSMSAFQIYLIISLFVIRLVFSAFLQFVSKLEDSSILLLLEIRSYISVTYTLLS